jgi:hypothetical protein
MRPHRIFLTILLSGIPTSVGISRAAPTPLAPPEKYNLPVQRRTRTCAPMKGDRVPLRFADGTPNGFFARADDPSQQGGNNNKPCPIGCMEIDAHEIITTASGMKLYFHPGGGPGHYKDHVENGQYGHVAADDLKPPLPQVKPTGNGAPAPTRGGASYFITPTRMPPDMWYKPNVNDDGRSGSTYFTYGNPGFDKSRGRGDFTYINWSWVQNGGEKYPDNICHGGGMVRALGKRGMIFSAADVQPIVGYSYGPDNNINGRVTAFYGRTTATGGEARDTREAPAARGGGNRSGSGSEIFGWLPHSYQKTGDIIVPYIRRSATPPREMRKPEPSADRMVRMARNLSFEATPDAAQRTELLKKFAAEREPAVRMELLTELSRMDDLAGVNALLKLLHDEKDSRVREQAIALIGFMRAAAADVKRVAGELTAHQTRVREEREKERVNEAMERLGVRDVVPPTGKP